jgi:multiple sugar transport system substrate-binding protein
MLSRPTTRRMALAGLGALAAPAVLGQGVLGTAAHAQAPVVNFVTWTNAVEQIRTHIAGFVRATGIRVAHQHVPWASYRNQLSSRLRLGAPTDVVWMADSWAAEFAQAGLIAPIDDLPELTRFNTEALAFCTEAMRFQGRQYGLGYYTDTIAFIVNRPMLLRAGIARLPETWEEVLAQAQFLKQGGHCEQPLMLPLAKDPWLVEVLHAMAFAFDGAFVDDDLRAASGRPALAAAAALGLLREAIAPRGLMPVEALDTSEDEVFAAMGAGRHAFTLLPSYRLAALNDPTKAAAAGAFRAAVMPNGGSATRHESCGWVRFYAMTANAKADPDRRRNAMRLMAAFGRRDWTGEYGLQRELLLQVGLPFCALPVQDDPVVQRFLVAAHGEPQALREQRLRIRAKPVHAPWFSAWQLVAGDFVRGAIDGRMEAEEAVALLGLTWERLRAGPAAGGR